MSHHSGQATVRTGTLRGIDAIPVEVQVDVGRGLPAFRIVGLGDIAVQEARERVRAAIRSSGLSFPDARVTVNLAPAPLKKHGTGFDLPIAAGILVATGQVEPRFINDSWLTGELALDGGLRPVNGMLCHAIAAAHERRVLVCSVDSEPEISAVDALHWRGIDRLSDVCRQSTPTHRQLPPTNQACTADLGSVAGHQSAKRALEIAAAGALNVLMVGPPGSGKTMLARCLPGILPPMSHAEALETAVIHSVAGLDSSSASGGTRPFRAPHHASTLRGLIGGGSPIRPGEVSLAHNGVLFLDELPEFGPATLQALRQPMEDRRISLVRAEGRVDLPADFMFIAAANPCPCGFLGDPDKRCTCSETSISRYASRIGGPLMDRIDICLRVDRIDPGLLMSTEEVDESTAVRTDVQRARTMAESRGASNRLLNGVPLLRACSLTPDCVQRVEEIASHARLSGRGVTRLLRVARTIADLESTPSVMSEHLDEAASYRILEGR